MKKILCLMSAAAVLVGCGGGGDDFFNTNRFDGRWEGSVFGGNNPREDMFLDIRTDGSITGWETVNNATANLDGFVDRDGRFEIRSRLSGSQDTFYRGTMVREGNDRLRGDGTATQGSTTVNLRFELIRRNF